jgi:serine/threonine-protein kinase
VVPSDLSGEDRTILASDAPPAVAMPTVGESFAGRYRIDRELGRGAMGAVFAAHDDDVGEDVAIKILTLPDDGALERFRREVRLARRVTHRNAARTYDLGEHGGIRYLTMELVTGESLADRLAQTGRLGSREVAQIGRQICEGLQAAHDVGVVHRDLKPANVLMETSGRVVITDFGVARALGGDALVTMDPSAMVGTPAYMAPEQIDGSPIDARTDLYALGVMLYEMVTGQRPFTGDTAVAVAVARLQLDPVDPRTHVSMPDDLAALVLRCLGRTRQSRPSSAAEVAESLGALGAGSTMAPVAAPVNASAVVSGGPVSSSTRSLFVNTSPGDRALAVLPFRFRGPAEDAYLADVLTDELVDLLSMTRGLKVSGAGATARFTDERDARSVGRELEVEAVVDGTIQRAGDQVRIAARLLSAADGAQIWSERFEGRLDDVFDLQDRIAKRIAESLRLELIHFSVRGRVPAQVAETYLRARGLAAASDMSGASLQQAIERYDACLDAVPDFAPALAGKANACATRWFLPSASKNDLQDWEARTRDAVAAALAGAAHMAETHLAAARERVSHGDFQAAAHHLRVALEIAPTYAGAHDYLGFLQCEAGRPVEGVRHILLARELDPSLSVNMLSALRARALAGDTEGYEQMLAEAKAGSLVPRFALGFTEMRVAAWHGDGKRVSESTPRMGDVPNIPAVALPRLFREVYLGELAPEAAEVQLAAVVNHTASPRFRAIVHQVATELFAVLGQRERALAHMQAADAEGVLVDADWFERCPALESLRDDPAFATLRDKVRLRADAIWRTR